MLPIKKEQITAINDAGDSGGEIDVSAIARTAEANRTFLYRHPDLLAQVHAAYTTAALVGVGAMVVTTLTSVALVRRRSSETNP